MSNRRPRKGSIPYPSDGGLGCTTKCQLPAHADLALSCAALGNLELLRHCKTVCANYCRIRDEAGRNVLHVAASCGHHELVDWLLNKKKAQVDTADGESCWTPLHRSAYFGNAGICSCLVKYGASMGQIDSDYCTPLHILQSNFQLLDPIPAVSEICLYTWGSNANATLGHYLSRNIPEHLETEPTMGDIVQVVLRKFHSVFLSKTGSVYTCGHGRGGRLGHGSENSVVSPKLVEGLKRGKSGCVAIGAARDHSVFLMKNGSVYTCGLNDGHQLGQGTKPPNAPAQCLSPTIVKACKNMSILFVGAGRYHTAVATGSKVLTFGKNLGQLGYEKCYDTQILPKMVAGIHVEKGDSISCLSVSDGATACITRKKHQIFVCINFRVMKCDMLGLPEAMTVMQFDTCATLGALNHKKRRDSNVSSQGTLNGETVIMALDSSNRLWAGCMTSDASKRHEKGFTTLQHMAGSSKCRVAHFSLGKSLSVVTDQGELYTGHMPCTVGQLDLLSLERVPLVQQATAIFTDYKANNSAVLQSVYGPPELPIVEKSTFSRDFCQLLNDSCLSATTADVEFQVSGQTFIANRIVLAARSPVFRALFFQSDANQTSSLPALIKHINKENSCLWQVEVDLDSPLLFQLFLRYLYGGKIIVNSRSADGTIHMESSPPNQVLPSDSLNTSLASEDGTSSTNNTDWNALYDMLGVNEKAQDFPGHSLNGHVSHAPQQSFLNIPEKPTKHVSQYIYGTGEGDSDSGEGFVYETVDWQSDLKVLMQLAVGFGIEDLQKCLESRQRPRKNKKTEPLPSTILPCSPLARFLSHAKLPHDLVLISEEGKEIYTHKCILATRSDYFESMLLMGWRESSKADTMTTLKLPVSHPLLNLVVDYLSKDSYSTITESQSIPWLTSALVVADQFLLLRLKSICEKQLAKFLTLRNVADILEFCSAYNAIQLKCSCLQFICVNLPALLEARLLDQLPLSLLEELSQTYHKMLPSLTKRVIKLPEPSTENLPKSYFSNEPLMVSDMEEDGEEESVDRSFGSMIAEESTPSRNKSPVPELARLTSTPSSAGRKKRRRKASTSDKRHSVTPPVSPDPLAAELTLSFNDSLSPEPYMRSLSSDEPDPPTQESNNSKNRMPKNEEVEEKSPGSHDLGVNSKTTSLGGRSPWLIETTPNKSPGAFRDIMAEEKHKVESQLQSKKNQKPLIHRRPQKGGHVTVSPLPISTPSVRSPPAVDRTESLPSKLSQSPSAWGNSHQPTSPTVSLRDLMAAEAEEEQRLKQANSRPSNGSSKGGKAKFHRSLSGGEGSSGTHHTPPSIQHPVVSFADIVSSQQQEMDNKSRKEPSKPLDMIQIEERAMQELLKLYNPSGDPSERITVERYPKRATPTTSPRNKGGRGGESRDRGKAGGRGRGRGRRKQVNPAQVSAWDRQRLQQE